MHDVEKILSSERAEFNLISSNRVLLRETILADRAIRIIPGSSIGNFLSEGMCTRLVTNFPVTNGIYVIFREHRKAVSAFIRAFREGLTGTA